MVCAREEKKLRQFYSLLALLVALRDGCDCARAIVWVRGSCSCLFASIHTERSASLWRIPPEIFKGPAAPEEP